MNQPSLFDAREFRVADLDATEAESLIRECVTRLLSLGMPCSFYVGGPDAIETSHVLGEK